MPSRVGDLIAEHIRRRPDAAALVAPDGRLTYAALAEEADALTARLVQAGVGPGDVVLVQLPRGVALGIAVLGVLRAGGVLCVVDPGYPQQRIRQMWSDSGARVGLVAGADGTSGRVPDLVAVSDDPVAVSHTEPAACLATDHDRLGTAVPLGTPDGPGWPRAVPRADDLAYAVFTSGSTGRPKAVAMPHRGLDNMIAWTLADTSSEPLRTLMFAPLGFDVFLQEVFTTWCSGGCLYALDDADRSNLQHTLRLLARHHIQRLFVPPVALSRLADLAVALGPVPESLREVAVAGEALRITPGIRELFSRVPGARLHNHYGPAETHAALAHTLTGPPGTWPDMPPIGTPIPGMAAHLRPAGTRPGDRDGEGEVAELWLSGVGLARGYLRDEERTAERFAVLPAGADGVTVRAYRTGDLVHRRADGLFEFRGRVDDQVKIRGHRVEPGEVEATLSGHPAIRECAVTAWEPPGGAERRLVAHVVFEPGHSPDHAALSGYLHDLLPDHMVPRHFMTAEKLPLSAHGKVDRSRLPAPAPQPAGPPTAGPVPDSVAHVLGEVLGVRVTDPGRSFAELGGTSLSAALAVTRLHARFGVRIDLQEFLQTPTVDALSALISERSAS